MTRPDRDALVLNDSSSKGKEGATQEKTKAHPEPRGGGGAPPGTSLTSKDTGKRTLTDRAET